MPEKLFRLSQSRENCQIRLRTQPAQLMHRFEFSMKNSRLKRGIRVGAVCAQDLDERYLYLAFAGHTARCNQAQGVVDRPVFRPRFEDGHCNIDNIRRQGAMPDWVLCNEFQQTRIAEVVAALEENALVNEASIFLEQKR